MRYGWENKKAVVLDWDRIYCEVEDFCRVWKLLRERQQIEAGIKHRGRPSALTLSEVMTLIIAFPLAGFRNFKHFYSTSYAATIGTASQTS